jgi:hypothetical protein
VLAASGTRPTSQGPPRGGHATTVTMTNGRVERVNIGSTDGLLTQGGALRRGPGLCPVPGTALELQSFGPANAKNLLRSIRGPVGSNPNFLECHFGTGPYAAFRNALTLQNF